MTKHWESGLNPLVGGATSAAPSHKTTFSILIAKLKPRLDLLSKEARLRVESNARFRADHGVPAFIQKTETRKDVEMELVAEGVMKAVRTKRVPATRRTPDRAPRPKIRR